MRDTTIVALSLRLGPSFTLVAPLLYVVSKACMAVMYASIHVDTTYVSHSVGVWNLPAPTDWTYVSPISIDHEDIRKGITKLTWAYRFDMPLKNQHRICRYVS